MDFKKMLEYNSLKNVKERLMRLNSIQKIFLLSLVAWLMWFASYNGFSLRELPLWLKWVISISLDLVFFALIIWIILFIVKRFKQVDKLNVTQKIFLFITSFLILQSAYDFIPPNINLVLVPTMLIGVYLFRDKK